MFSVLHAYTKDHIFFLLGHPDIEMGAIVIHDDDLYDHSSFTQMGENALTLLSAYKNCLQKSKTFCDLLFSSGSVARPTALIL